MPKGRHLKPEFFTDGRVVACQPLARLLFQGLWCWAADCGHLDDRPAELKLRILPGDSCDVETLLGELASEGLIERDDGRIFVPTLAKHTRVDRRYETRCDRCIELQGEHHTEVHGQSFGLHKRWHEQRGIVKDDCKFCVSPQVTAPIARSEPTVSDSAHVVDTMCARSGHVVDGDGDGDGDGDVYKNSRSSTDVENDTNTTTSTTKTASKQKPGPSLEADFETWWTNYPRKQGKGQAVRAYRAARRKTTAETLHTAVQAQLPSLTLKGREFTPLPATWLNGERWLDEDVDGGPPDPWAHLDEWQPAPEAIEQAPATLPA